MPFRQLPKAPPQSASLVHGKPQLQTQVRPPKGRARNSGTALAGWATGQVSPWLGVARLSSRPVPQPGWAWAATKGAGTVGTAVSAEAGAAPARARTAIAKISIPNAFFTFMVVSSKAQQQEMN